jgi:hypothetical protein
VVSSRIVEVDVAVNGISIATFCTSGSAGTKLGFAVASAATVGRGGDNVVVVKTRSVELETTVEVEMMFSVEITSLSWTTVGSPTTSGAWTLKVVRLMMSEMVLRGRSVTSARAMEAERELNTVNSPALAEVLNAKLEIGA